MTKSNDQSHNTNTNTTKIPSTEWKEKTKQYAWNASSTKNISQNSIEVIPNGNELNDYIVTEDVINIMENVFPQLNASLKPNIEKKDANDWILDVEIRNCINTKSIIDFLVSKSQKQQPYHFFKLVDLIKGLCETVALFHNKKLDTLNDKDFLSKEVFLKYVNNETCSRSKLDILHQFYKRIDPNEVHIEKAFWEHIPRRVVQKLDHPDVMNYLMDLSKNGVREISLEGYLAYFKIFLIWITTSLSEFKSYDINNVPIYRIRADHLEDYKDYLLNRVKNHGAALNKASDNLIIIKSLFKFLYRKKYILTDVAYEVENISQQRYMYRDIPDDEDLLNFFEVVEAYSKNAEEEKLAFSTMLLLGVRVEELSKLEWDGLNLANQNIWFVGKFNKSSKMYVPNSIVSQLQNLQHRQNKKSGYIFSNSPEAFYRKLYQNYKVYSRIAGWDYKGGLHLFRHLFITKLSLNKECLPGIIKDLSRVEKLDTVSYYIHRSQGDLTDSVNKIKFFN